MTRTAARGARVLRSILLASGLAAGAGGAVLLGAVPGSAAPAPRGDACRVDGGDRACTAVRVDPSSGEAGTRVTVRAEQACDPAAGAELRYFAAPEGGVGGGGSFESTSTSSELSSVGRGDVVEEDFAIPDDAAPASVFAVFCEDDAQSFGFATFTIIDPATVPVTPDPGTAAPGSSGTAGGSASSPFGPGESHERPALSASLRAPGDVSTEPGLLVANLVIAAMMVLLVFPAELFNATLEEHYDDVRRWFRRPLTLVERFSGFLAARGPRGGFVIVTAATAVLYGFLDPGFGGDTASIATVVGVGSAIAATILLSGWALRRYRGKAAGDGGMLRSYPAALIVALACVVVSRVADFQPGYLYGIVASFVFTSALSQVDEGRSTAYAAIVGLVVSLLAWIAWIPIDDSVDGGGNFVTLTLDAFLATMFVGGLQALVFGFIPLRFLPGAKVWAWSKPVWAALFAIGSFGFLHVLLHPEDEFSGSITTMAVLFVAFTAVSVGFWVHFRRSPAAPVPVG